MQTTVQPRSEQTQGQDGGLQENSLFNNTADQYPMFPNQGAGFKPAVQPQVFSSNSQLLHDFSKGPKFNLENQPQFDDAMVAQLLSSYINQDSNLIQPHQLQETRAPDQMIHQQDGSVQNLVEDTFSRT